MKLPTWHDSEIIVVDDPQEGPFILPQDREVKIARESILRAEQRAEKLGVELARLQREDAGPEDRKAIGRIKRTYEDALEDIRILSQSAEAGVSLLDGYRNAPNATTFAYQVRCPDFGEYTFAEEASVDYLPDGVVVVPQRRMRELLVSRVQLDGKVFSLSDVKALHPAVATKLHNHIVALAYPDSSRLPFLQGSSTPSGAAP